MFPFVATPSPLWRHLHVHPPDGWAASDGASPGNLLPAPHLPDGWGGVCGASLGKVLARSHLLDGLDAAPGASKPDVFQMSPVGLTLDRIFDMFAASTSTVRVAPCDGTAWDHCL